MTTDSKAIASELADRYRIVRELGAGGMATVYLADDLRHNRQVALKVLRDDLTASLGKERFLREVDIAAGLTHPHIVALYDSGEAAGKLFYVMPFVEGHSLRDRLVRAGELPISDAVRILRDIADAIAYAHERGVVHRDLKPENVMLTGRHALVTDFGVAKAVSEATGRHALTTAGVALGTPAYMSPEQATADPQADTRSDIYSFGVLAYELLAGRTPFGGGTPQQVLAAHVTSTATPITTHRPSIPAALAELVMECLEKKPADRPQKAEELVTRLESVLTPSAGSHPLARQQHDRNTQTGSASLMRRPVALAVGAFVLVVIGTLAWRAVAARTGAENVRAKLVVMPLTTRSTDSTQALLAEGLAEQIGVRLSHEPLLQVLSAAAVSRQWRMTPDPLEAGNALGAKWVVTGSLRTVGDAISALIEVVDARSGVRKWSGSFPRTTATFATLEAAVAESIHVVLAGRNVARPSSVGTVRAPSTPEAYRLVLLGNVLLSRRTPESVRRAIGYFTQATQLDSNFAVAWARLSQAYLVFYSWNGWDMGVPRDSLLARARVSAERALMVDSTLSAAWRSDASVALMKSEWPTAKASFDRALRLDSLDADAYYMYGFMYGAERLNAYDRAEPLFRRSLALDPSQPNTWRALSLVMSGRGKFAEAEALLDTALALGDWAPGYSVRAKQRFLRGDGAGALSDLENADRLNGSRDERARILYRIGVGDTRGALDWITQHPLPKGGATLTLTDAFVAIHTAALKTALGKHAEAVTLLELLPRDGAWPVLNDPVFMPLRNDARFQVLLDNARPAFLAQQ